MIFIEVFKIVQALIQLRKSEIKFRYLFYAEINVIDSFKLIWTNFEKNERKEYSF